jgi:hypothetical protein
LGDGDAFAEGEEVFAGAAGAEEVDHFDGLGVVVDHALHEGDIGVGDGEGLGGGFFGGEAGWGFARGARADDGDGLGGGFCRLAEGGGRADQEHGGEKVPDRHALL